MNKNFFGSKLNSVLLLVLIILMIIAIRMMFQNKEIYFNLSQQNQEQKNDDNIAVRQILGNKDDLVSFSILPNQEVQGIVSYSGVIKGGYFFEGNIVINVLDANKNPLKAGNTMATTDWMTLGPVSFAGKIDFSGLQKGPAYVEIHNDNPSDLRKNDKSILIPVVIE